MLAEKIKDATEVTKIEDLEPKQEAPKSRYIDPNNPFFDPTDPYNDKRSPKQERLYNIIRKCRGVTAFKKRGNQSERGFGVEIGVSYQTLQNLRKGEFNPSAGFVSAVAHRIGWTYEDLDAYIEYGLEPGLDQTEDVMSKIRVMHRSDVIKILDMAVMRLSDLEKFKTSPDHF